MFATLSVPQQRKLMLPGLLLLALGMGLWASFGAGYGQSLTPVTVSAHCVSEADALAAMDRSRNGISLTCNNDILRKGAVR